MFLLCFLFINQNKYFNKSHIDLLFKDILFSSAVEIGRVQGGMAVD